MCPLTCKVSNLSKEITEPNTGVATIWFCEKYNLRLDFCSIATSTCGNFPPYSKNGFFRACITATISPALTHWSSTSSPLTVLFNAQTPEPQFTSCQHASHFTPSPRMNSACSSITMRATDIILKTTH